MRSAGYEVFGTFEKFEELFAFILNISKKVPLTLIIDEFQDFNKINSSIFSSIQKIWDLYKDRSHVHLIICGSVYTLMKKIFEESKEPLFGRADFKIDLQPLPPKVFKEILSDHRAYSPRNLLDFYTITGGVAKYIELLVLYEAFDFQRIIEEIVSPFSFFWMKGKTGLSKSLAKNMPHTFLFSHF